MSIRILAFVAFLTGHAAAANAIEECLVDHPTIECITTTTTVVTTMARPTTPHAAQLASKRAATAADTANADSETADSLLKVTRTANTAVQSSLRTYTEQQRAVLSATAAGW